MSGKPIDEAARNPNIAVIEQARDTFPEGHRLRGALDHAAAEMIVLSNRLRRAEAALTAAQQQGQAVDCSDCTNSQQCDKCSRGEWETLPQPTQQGDGETYWANGAQWPNVAPVAGGIKDTSTFSDVEDALDRIDAPARADDGRWLTLPERIAALATQHQEPKS